MPERTLCSQGNLIEVLTKPTPLIYALLFFWGGGGGWGRLSVMPRLQKQSSLPVCSGLFSVIAVISCVKLILGTYVPSLPPPKNSLSKRTPLGLEQSVRVMSVFGLRKGHNCQLKVSVLPSCPLIEVSFYKIASEQTLIFLWQSYCTRNVSKRAASIEAANHVVCNRAG